MSKFFVTKSYRDFPAAHRQHNHKGHCRYIHGHNWGWDIEFSCQKLDDCGFVIDVGTLQKVKDYLIQTFDHTLLLNEDDPFRERLQSKGFGLGDGFADIVLVPNCGMEGLAKLVFETVNYLIQDTQELPGADRGLVVTKVTCWEDSKNSATYLSA